MAKRYHQNYKDEGMERRGRRMHGMHGRDGEYAGMETRRHQEMMDSGMISEDHHEIANMPQNVMMKPWPMAAYDMPEEGLDDTIRGVNEQMNRDGSQMRKHNVAKKV